MNRPTIKFLSILFLTTIPLTIAAQEDSEKLQSNIFLQEDLVMPLDLAYVDGLLFVNDVYGSSLITGYDAISGEKLIEFGRSGSGPGEYESVTIQKGPGTSTLEVVDVNNKKIDVYDVNCLKNFQSANNTASCIENTYMVSTNRHAVTLTGNLIVNHNITPDGVLQISKEEIHQENLDTVPEELLNRYDRPIYAAMAMSGRITANHDRSYFAYFADSFDHALFFHRSDTEIRQIHEQTFTFIPDYTVENIGGSAILNEGDSYTYTFGSPDSGFENYYVLYSGKTSEDTEFEEGAEWRAFTNIVKVYNWQGSKERAIYLDIDVFIITVSHDEQSLFGINYDEGMNPSIIKVSL